MKCVGEYGRLIAFLVTRPLIDYSRLHSWLSYGVVVGSENHHWGALVGYASVSGQCIRVRMLKVTSRGLRRPDLSPLPLFTFRKVPYQPVGLSVGGIRKPYVAVRAGAGCTINVDGQQPQVLPGRLDAKRKRFRRHPAINARLC